MTKKKERVSSEIVEVNPGLRYQVLLPASVYVSWFCQKKRACHLKALDVLKKKFLFTRANKGARFGRDKQAVVPHWILCGV